MKYLFPIFLLPIFANSQTITYMQGAGVNPTHIESIGPESGWVELIVGDMDMEGDVFRILVPDEIWIEIEKIHIAVYDPNGTHFETWEPSNKPGKKHIGLKTTGNGQSGVFIRYEYKFTFKRA